VIIDEPVRGSVPPAWFWALPGIERIRALSLSQLPAPPLSHLIGIRPAHVGLGSGTWSMPASEWSQDPTERLELGMLAEAATTGVAMTTLPPGMDVEPVALELHHFRPSRSQPGNLLARAQVVNESRFLIATEVAIEDPQGRQIAHGVGHCRIRQVLPPPPPPPSALLPVDEPTYATPDPYLRPPQGEFPSTEFWEEHDGNDVLQGYAEGRFVAPFARLTGCRIDHSERSRLVLTLPASEWFCQYSRSVAHGYIASLAYLALTNLGLTVAHRGESFVGIAQSVWFLRPVPIDGRTLIAEEVGARREGDVATAEVHIYDADRALAARAHGLAMFVERSKRQKRPVPNATRILATLLFTDIVESTQHAERLGDARWRILLDQHHQAVRAEIARHGGVEIDTAGDGFFVRFDTPASALQCARGVRDTVKRLGIEVRAGIHTGECEMQDRKLTGVAVHLASRIQALAAPGEILVSSTVKDLGVGSPFHFEDRGEHALKGLPGAWHLFSLAE